MKKIVALVLSLVMVLGLATVAFAAPTEVVGTYEIIATDDDAGIKTAVDSIYLTAAVAPADKDEDGVIDEAGEKGAVAFYTVTWASGAVTKNLLAVNSAADADYMVYVKGATAPYLYLANEHPVMGATYNSGAVAFTDFGKACGQYKWADVKADGTYYLYKGAVYEKSATGNTQFMINGELVLANVAAGGAFVAHTPVYTQAKDGTVTAIACAKCDAVGVIVANYASLPVAKQVPGLYFSVPGSATKLFYWAPAAVDAPATDKVESAQTFDAGIAMYVGMSVMAAAGSAVVLKKKD